MNKRLYFIVFILFLTTLFFAFYHPAKQLQADENEYYLKIQHALTNFQNVYKQVNMHYVEEIDPYEFILAGIDGMLEKLDPYTVFIDPEGDARLRIITTGKYGGLGMEIGMRNDQITIISPMENSPAKRAGFRAGDIIISIDGFDVSDFNTREVSEKLRGPIGTGVEITIIRPGFEDPISKKLTRAEITIEDVTYSGFVAPGMAYVRLTGFTDKAAQEVKKAINELKSEQEITSFILDLRGNSGGLLESAVEIASLFVEPGSEIVSTRGFREREYTFKTSARPLLPDIPVAVMVDGGSASASEIVAGALQDMDRAIIIGNETFGKGLVQKVFNIDKRKNTKIKITTAKYYIPSGRCIQKADYTKDNDILYHPDSAQVINDEKQYFTQNNRPVFEKGGIMPDIFVEEEEYDNIIIELWKKSILFNFAVEYYNNNPVWSGNFEISNDIFNEFLSFAGEQKFNYAIEGEKEIEAFLEAVNKNKLHQEVKQDAQNILNELQDLKALDLVAHKDQIKRALYSELAEKYFGSKEKIKLELEKDIQIKSAIQVLMDQKEYNSILAIK